MIGFYDLRVYQQLPVPGSRTLLPCAVLAIHSGYTCCLSLNTEEIPATG